ncbi:MAG TPA: efflux RND transporter permease subunit [bacterium]|nr:efflux RND transporter permease subunit [bacterium]HOL47911.1 efflux RND transporter permease subunit [bacterium]HPQ19226.1 efflux RND transporter permease subunit [bacterium]
MNIIEIALKRRTTVFVLIIGIILGGYYSYIILPREAAPEVKLPLLIVNTFYFGVSPEDIENLITNRIERELKNLDGLKKITSTSMESLSSIVIEFMPNVNLDVARQKVKDKVDVAKPKLPEGAEEPTITEINFSEFPILYISLSGKNIGLYKLKEIADNLKDKIKLINGVLDVSITGGLEREIQVNIDPIRMRYYDVSLNDIIMKIRNENITLPGGGIKVGKFEYSVRMPGEIKKVEDMYNWIIKEKSFRPVYFRDIATITYRYKEKTSISRLNGEEAITLSIKKRVGANIIHISDAIKKLMKEEEKNFPESLKYTYLNDQSKDIKMIVDELENNIITALFLVVGVLFFALGFRNALLVGVAIPLSMLITFLIINAFSITLNMIVLFSLILVLGMLVDNAIVLVENVYRHKQLGESNFEATLNGTNEIAIPILTSTLTTIAAFIPLLFWPGVIGDFMGYLPKIVIFGLSASFIVAIIINPVLCSKFIRSQPKTQLTINEDNIVCSKKKYNLIIYFYRRILLLALQNRWKTIFIFLIIFILTIIIYAKYGEPIILFPDVDPRNIIISIEFPKSTILSITDNFVKMLEEKIKKFPDIVNYISNVGSSDKVETNKATINIDLKDLADRKQNSNLTLNQIRDNIGEYAGVNIKVEKPQEGPPTGAAIAIELSGKDFNVLKIYKDKIKNLIKDIPGVINLRDDFEEGKPEIKINIDREIASRWGLSVASISSTIQSAIMGTEASKFRIGEDEYDITVRFNEDKRQTFSDLEEIVIYGPENRKIPLKNIAKFERTPGYGTIKHKDLKRMITIEADVREGYNAYLIRKEIVKLLSQIQFSTGYFYYLGGEDEEQRESSKFLSQAFLIAILLIALILVSQFNSVVLPFIILFSVVLSTIGVLWGLLITRINFSIIMTGLGIISLAGIVVNNSILLIDFIENARKRGTNKTTAIIQSGIIRMRPVMLTAITTLLGLIPMAVGVSFDFKKFEFITKSESSQWWSSMCVAIIFGLTVSTLLTLVFVPVLYSIIDTVRGQTSLKSLKNHTKKE